MTGLHIFTDDSIRCVYAPRIYLFVSRWILVLSFVVVCLFLYLSCYEQNYNGHTNVGVSSTQIPFPWAIHMRVGILDHGNSFVLILRRKSLMFPVKAVLLHTPSGVQEFNPTFSPAFVIIFFNLLIRVRYYPLVVLNCVSLVLVTLSLSHTHTPYLPFVVLF